MALNSEINLSKGVKRFGVTQKMLSSTLTPLYFRHFMYIIFYLHNIIEN